MYLLDVNYNVNGLRSMAIKIHGHPMHYFWIAHRVGLTEYDIITKCIQITRLSTFLPAAQLAEPSGLRVLRVHVNVNVLLALFKSPDLALAQESKRGKGR